MADKNKPAFYLIDTQSAFYKPFNRRLIICISVVAWACLETWHKDPFWSVISIACAVYCIYVLFWTYTPPRPPDVDDEDEEKSVAESVEPADADDKTKPSV